MLKTVYRRRADSGQAPVLFTHTRPKTGTLPKGRRKKNARLSGAVTAVEGVLKHLN